MSKNLDRTIREAQEFIDSIKEFNKDASSFVRTSGDYPSGSSDPSLPNGLNKDEVLSSSLQNGIEDTLDTDPQSLPHALLPSFSNQNLKQEDKLDKIKGFPTLSFSRNHEYENPFRADLLTFIETYFYTNKKLPTTKELANHFSGHPECPKYYTQWTPILDEISDSLSNRGIKPYNTNDEYIDPRFAWAVSLVVNHLDKRTIPAKLKEAGLSTKDWQAFLRRKRYYQYFQARLDDVFDNDVKNDAKIAIARAIQNGDLQAVKYYNELKNIYRPETQSAQQMVAVVLTAIMEILATHVSSDILNRVAVEIRESPSVLKVINTTAS